MLDPLQNLRPENSKMPSATGRPKMASREITRCDSSIISMATFAFENRCIRSSMWHFALRGPRAEPS